jgi:hypothetical protein
MFYKPWYLRVRYIKDMMAPVKDQQYPKDNFYHLTEFDLRQR